MTLRALKSNDQVSSSEAQGRNVILNHARCISRHGFHTLAYREYPCLEPTSDVICVHGLTRNSRDFDVLASRLSSMRRVICADLAGRGDSDWLTDPSDYNLLQYNMDMTVVAAKAGLSRYDWIGTSLGGLIGIALAGLENSPIQRLIINDIGPDIPFSALRRITSYAGQTNQFDSLKEVENHLRQTLSPFGPMTDTDWARMAQTSCFETSEGYHLHHDPDIMQNFRNYFMFMHFNLWKFWDRIKCPVLVLRGMDSDFLPESLLDKMLRRLPNATAIEFPDVGHTPTLNAAEQIEPIQSWLSETDPGIRETKS